MQVTVCDNCKKKINPEKHEFVSVSAMRLSDKFLVSAFSSPYDFCSIDCLVAYKKSHNTKATTGGKQ